MKEVVIDQKLQSNLSLLIGNTLEEEKNLEGDLNFFFNNDASQPKQTKYETKKIKPHNMTRIKSQNFLSNISYNGVKEEDLFDRSFVFDIYVLTTKSINPCSLERKIFDVKDREMINLFWEDCNEMSFYKHIHPYLYLYPPKKIWERFVDDVYSIKTFFITPTIFIKT